MTLAAAALDDLRGALPGGICVAPLERQAGPDAVAAAASPAAGLRLDPRQAVLPQLTLALDGHRALLLLDGFGTHLDQVRTVDALVRATAGATVLVTSRMRLGLATEMVGEVGPRGRAPTRGPGARRSAPGRRAIRFGLTRGPPGPVAPPFHARFTLASLPAP